MTMPQIGEPRRRPLRYPLSVAMLQGLWTRPQRSMKNAVHCDTGRTGFWTLDLTGGELLRRTLWAVLIISPST
jgi:hypothetical protein